ncbi:MAG: DUF2062 domain-containing protein [Cyanobacteria bacterium]|nr:DUF2062 domain-containing protein [Cyanobacteriota bacterium]MDW8200751.1 DUF2062 domain-containing protein [Cyanobacteriota bacterium SKYGB_h_bin112]
MAPAQRLPRPPKPKSWRRRWRYYYWKLVRLRSTPESMALGLAMGVLVGMIPLFGMQSLLSIGLATLVGGNKWLAVLGTWISNPVTDVPLVLLNFRLGQWLLRNHSIVDLRVESFQDLVNLGGELVTVLITGCLVTGTISAIVTYVVSIRLFRRMRARYHRQKNRRGLY